MPSGVTESQVPILSARQCSCRSGSCWGYSGGALIACSEGLGPYPGVAGGGTRWCGHGPSRSVVDVDGPQAWGSDWVPDPRRATSTGSGRGHGTPEASTMTRRRTAAHHQSPARLCLELSRARFGTFTGRSWTRLPAHGVPWEQRGVRRLCGPQAVGDGGENEHQRDERDRVDSEGVDAQSADGGTGCKADLGSEDADAGRGLAGAGAGEQDGLPLRSAPRWRRLVRSAS